MKKRNLKNKLMISSLKIINENMTLENLDYQFKK